MNTVYVTTPTGINFSFKSGANNFIDNVIRAVERLERDYNYKTEVMKMGKEFSVGVY
jgi:hypothetical protein